jgi:glycosyltransferase involved in cell wall biosynthesis
MVNAEPGCGESQRSSVKASESLVNVSVIIPTYNRADVLRKTLDAYGSQRGDHRLLEVLVVDDGSTDNTGAVVSDVKEAYAVRLRYLRQNNAGLAAARNHGIKEAEGELILFGDDDIVPAADMVSEHVTWHRRNPQTEVAILGNVSWAREMRPTPFMMWSGNSGPQFNFANFTPGSEIDFRYGYFCNTSVKTRFLLRSGVFDESFRTYGYEDVELSYRLAQNGYRLLYNPSAVGYHYKFERFEDTKRRVEQLYRSWPRFARTEAGREFLRLWNANRQKPAGRTRRALKGLLRPVKAYVMPVVKPLLNTRVPLPGWLYGQVFYHYVMPFSEAIRVTDIPDESRWIA